MTIMLRKLTGLLVASLIGSALACSTQEVTSTRNPNSGSGNGQFSGQPSPTTLPVDKDPNGSILPSAPPSGSLGPSPSFGSSPRPTPSAGGGQAFFTSSVVSAVTTSCAPCHTASASGGMMITNYAQARQRLKSPAGATALNNTLMTRVVGINHNGAIRCTNANASPCNVFQQWFALEP